MTPALDVVIVNWNTGQQLRDCLKSFGDCRGDGYVLNRVVVVDNASTDGSADGLHDQGLPLHVIRNTENRGFATACNQGAQGCQADYLLFLNPDTRLFSDSLRQPVLFMEQPENARVGICGIQLVDEGGNVSRTCARFPMPHMFLAKMLGLDQLFPRRFQSYFLNGWDHRESRAVDHVIGAFFLVRCSVFELLGGFDESFFVYLEDLDFSKRACQVGWNSFYYADVQAYHKGGGASEKVKAKRLFYSLKSRIAYGYKHFDWISATGLMLGTLLLEPVARIGLAGREGSLSRIVETTKAYGMLWHSLLTKNKAWREW